MKKNKHKIRIACGIIFLISQISLAALHLKIDDSSSINFGSIFRSYYINDQRIQWSGVEATFGVEAALTADIQRKIKGGNVGVFSEIFLNQPFDQNILTDERREKYIPNFQVTPCEIAQLFVGITKGSFSAALGKKETNFGKPYSLPLLNSYLAQPFIRTEAILRYETGLFLTYDPGILDLSLAIVNGSEGMDTNSSKAGIIRLGLKGGNWALGVSAKAQDGIGSENQKMYKNHAGLDLMVKAGRFRFSAEVIYDEYGFRKEYKEENIFWKRSLYYRDVFYKYETPVTGIGGYINLQYETRRWSVEVNYGEYYPEEIDSPFHDDPIKRGVVKLRIPFAPGFHLFCMGLFENDRRAEDLFKGASGFAFLLGLQYRID
ncbi:MAG: hypothetical protein KAT34_03325 [Candidatus Aminicenantes bacterium]|nr:hypothetical protein [Candidatus Aminicenantes bacterium]